MTWCQSCGAQYTGATHNCGWATITKDRLRELIEAERKLNSDAPRGTQGGSEG
jgi:hypothetical protein